jgi:hypothetical protein
MNKNISQIIVLLFCATIIQAQEPDIDDFDETLTYWFLPLIQAKFGIKNLLNADIRQPSYYYNIDGGIKREERNYLLSYVQKF